MENKGTPSNTIEWIKAIELTLRLLTIAFFVVVLWLTYTTDVRGHPTENRELKLNITGFLVYRYMLGCAIIGIIFTIILFNLTISQPAAPQEMKGFIVQKYELYNEVMLILVASGGAATMGFTLELNRLQDDVLKKIVSSSIFNDMCLISGTYLLGFLSSLVSWVLGRIVPPF